MKESTPNYKGKGMTLRDIVDHGTPVQKAYKVIMEYCDPQKWTDPNEKVRTITEKAKDNILDSMNIKEKRIFNIYYDFYLTNLNLYVPFSRVCAFYERGAEILLGEYYVMQAEERLLTDIYNTLPEVYRGQFLEERGRVIDVVPQGDGKVKLFYKEENLLLWHSIKRDALDIISDYRDLKHFVVALETFYQRVYTRQRQWVESQEALKLFIPRVIVNLTHRAKSDYVGKFAPELSMKVYKERMEKGDVLGDRDYERAIAHYYEVLTVDRKEVAIHLSTISTEYSRVRSRHV